MSESEVVLGLDIGTSTCKGVAINVEGQVLAEARVEHEVLYPKAGWAEQDPEEHWWRGFTTVVKKLVKCRCFKPQRIVGIGVTGLGPNVIPIGDNGRPIRRAILYSDTRSVDEINYVRDNYGDFIFQISGNQVTSQTVAPKILWLKNAERGIFRRTAKILIGSYNYIVNRLTGAFSIDYGTAKWTGLFDGERLCWSDEICEELGIPRKLLPKVCHPTDIVGGVSKDISEKIEVPADTPVVAGALDSGAGTLSAGVIEPGEAVIIYGTTTILKVVIQDFKKDPRLHSDIHCVKPLRYFLGGATTTSGAIVRWFRDNFVRSKGEEGKLGDYRIMDEEASKIPSSGLIVLPYFMGERTPIFDPLAKGVIFGLTLSHKKAHVYRAILEATGYALLQHLEILRENGIHVKKAYVTGGGARSRVWRQIVSDIADIEQEYCTSLGAPFGAAYLAGYGIGLFKDFRTIKGWVRKKERNEPRRDLHETYRKYFEVYRNLYCDLRREFVEISRITRASATTVGDQQG